MAKQLKYIFKTLHSGAQHFAANQYLKLQELHVLIPLTFKFTQQTHTNRDPSLIIQEVGLQVFHHAKCAETFGTEHLVEGIIADSELFVIRIIELLLLNDGPHPLDNFVSGHLLFTHELGEGGRQFIGARVAAAFASVAALK